MTISRFSDVALQRGMRGARNTTKRLICLGQVSEGSILASSTSPTLIYGRWI